jgi:acetyltransferase-like isoleucine patch superfamily enzyme
MTNMIREAWLRFEDPLVLAMRARTKLYSLWLGATYPFVATGRKLSIQYPCALRRPSARHIRIGDTVIIGKDTNLFVVDDEVTGVKLVIDDNCTIGARSVISARNLIHIERDVITGASVLIQDHQHTHEYSNLPIRDQGITAGGKIRIERGCWIGQGAVIVCNEGEVVIGHNSVVGANSVVARSVPPYSVIVGNPGIVLKQFDKAKARTPSASLPIPIEASDTEATPPSRLDYRCGELKTPAVLERS